MTKRTRVLRSADSVTKQNLSTMSIFEHVKHLAGNKRRNLGWYRDTVRAIVNQKDLYATMASLEESLTPEPGNMYLFEYNATYAKKLPYYDTFPLVYALGGGTKFLGLNMHYLGLKHRMKFISDLENKNQISFPIQCFHWYVFDGLETPLYKVEREDYKSAIFLPIESFVSRRGGTYRSVDRQFVWNEGLHK